MTFHQLFCCHISGRHALDYVVGIVSNQHENHVAYNSDTLSDVVHKYPTYDKDMYSIVQGFQKWKYYILKKETIIHTDYKSL